MTDTRGTDDQYSGLGPSTDGPLSRRRRLIATRLSGVAREAVSVTLNRDVTVPSGRKPLDALVHAMTAALRRHPGMNGVLEGERLRTFSDVNLGIAYEGPLGLVVPVLRGAGSMSFDALSHARAELSAKVQKGEISMDELQGATFSITNLGPFSIRYFTPIINPPQLAILGVGTGEKTESGDTVLPLSLTFDHRINDGVAAANFMITIQEELQ